MNTDQETFRAKFAKRVALIILPVLLLVGIAAQWPVVDLLLQTDADGGGNNFTNLSTVGATNVVSDSTLRLASEVGESAEATVVLDRTSGTGFFQFISSITGYPVFMRLFGTNVSDSSTPGGAAMLMLNWTIQQAEAMGYTALRIIVDEQSVGSGNKWTIASGPADPDPTFTVDVDGNVDSDGAYTSDGIFTNGAVANTIYVDKVNGNDLSARRGSADKPFFQLQAALSNVVNGDTVILRPGLHAANLTGIPQSGSYESWDNSYFVLKSLTNVTIRGETGAILDTVDVGGGSLGNKLTIADCDNIRIEGITFRGDGANPVIADQICGEITLWGTNSNITIKDCTFIDYPDHGILLSQDAKATGPLVIGCKFIRGGTAQHATLNVDGAGVAGTGQGSQIVNNYFENVYRGIELEGPDDVGLGQTIITGNYMTNVWNLGILCLNTSGDDSKLTDVLIKGNTIFMHGSLEADVPSQHGIVATGGRRYNISDNIVRNAYHYGIFLTTSHWRLSDSLVQGNLVSECGANIVVQEAFLQMTNVTVQGNMVLNPTGTNIVVDGRFTKVINNTVKGTTGIGIYVPDVQDAGVTQWPYIAGNWIYGHEPAIQIDSGVLDATVFGNSAIGASTQLTDNGTDTVKSLAFTDGTITGYIENPATADIDMDEWSILNPAGLAFAPAGGGITNLNTINGVPVDLGTPTGGEVLNYDVGEAKLVLSSKHTLYGLGDEGMSLVFDDTGQLIPGFPVNTNSAFDQLTANILAVSNTATFYGPINATTGTFTGTLSVEDGAGFSGSGPNKFYGLALTDGNLNPYVDQLEVHGESINGAQSNRWELTVPNAHRLKVFMDVDAEDEDGNDLSNEGWFVFRREDGGSTEFVRSNLTFEGGSVRTNNLIRLNGNTVYFSQWAPAGKDMNSVGYLRWMTNPIIATAWAPSIFWDFEAAGTPSGWSSPSTNHTYDFTASPLNGSESLSMTNNGTSQTLLSGSQTGLGEVWGSFRIRVSGNPSALQTFTGVSAGGAYLCVLQMNTDRTVRARAEGGTASGFTATAVATAGQAYVKFRARKVQVANDAQMEAWVSTSPSTWNSSVSSTTGTTATVDFTRIGITQSSAFGAGFQMIVDDVIWSAEDIPTDYYTYLHLLRTRENTMLAIMGNYRLIQDAQLNHGLDWSRFINL